MALFTVAVLAALADMLPPLPASRATDLAALRRVVRLPGIRLGLVATVLIVVAHFATYTYVTPFLRSVVRVGEGSIGGFLLAYGIAGIVGNFAAGALITRRLSATFVVEMGSIALVTLTLPVVAGAGVDAGAAGHGPAIGLLVVWGLACGAVPVCSGAWFARSSAGLEEAGTVMWVSAFQASLSLGAYLGGVVVDATSVSMVMVLGGSCALSAVALVVVRRAARVRVPAGR